jgi:hypothetical protein
MVHRGRIGGDDAAASQPSFAVNGVVVDFAAEALRDGEGRPVHAAAAGVRGAAVPGREPWARRHQRRADGPTPKAWAMHAAALAAAGRTAEAAAWVGKAVAARPDLSIERMANKPGHGDAERRRLVGDHAAGGFPACASPEAPAKLAKPVRLPECTVRADAGP